MSKIRESARDEDCQVRLPGVCNFDPKTTVWAHPNEGGSGKGYGMKGLDALGAYACSQCHDVYDRRVPLPKGMRREDVEMAFHHAHQRSFVILVQKGLVICK